MTNVITILLVEDNPDHAFLAKESIKKAKLNNNVIVVEDGQEALDYLYRIGKFGDTNEYPLPDLILLDIKLPKKDGIEVLTDIKSNDDLKDIPVVMLTSSTRDEDIMQSYHNGANSYLTKPVSFTEFTEKMRDLQHYWCITNTMPPKKNNV